MTSKEINDLATLLSEGVQVVPEEGLRKKLTYSHKNQKPLQIKLGFDPTAPDLHLGHAVVLKKLREFQVLGHKICFIMGDFTARIGDPTGRNKTRPPLTKEHIDANAETYLAQLGKILDLSKVTVFKNSQWLESMNLSDVIGLLSKVTVAQIMQRHDFSDRFKNHQSIALHEILYPLMQGQDSVTIKADIELGGTDQLFNCMMGKALQESQGLPSQVVMCVPLLRGLDGVHKMGKSLNNYVGLTEDPKTMYGKVMSIPDHLLEEYLYLTTRFSKEKKDKLKEEIQKNPMDVKKQIAFDIVCAYHCEEAGQEAEEFFYKNVQSKGWKEKDFEEIHLGALKHGPEGALSLLSVCEKLLGDKSRSHIRKLIQAGAVALDEEKVLDPEYSLGNISGSCLLKIGKRNYYKLLG